MRILTAARFRAVCAFSEKDGYRADVRGKKDRAVIELLDAYLAASHQTRPAGGE